MTAAAIRILVKYLNNLEPAQLEKFKEKLCIIDAPRGTKKIQVSQLKNKSTKEIVRIIVDCYTIQKGPPHVVKILREINLNQKAIDLQKELKQDATTNKTEETPNSATPVGKKTATEKTTGAAAVGKKTATKKPTGDTAVCNPPKTSKAKTSTSTGGKIKDAKPTAETNVGVVANAKPTKKTTSKKQASDAIAGTSRNTGETSTQKKTPKRKLDQSEEQDHIDEQPAKVSKDHGGSSCRDLLLSILKNMNVSSLKPFKQCLSDEKFLKPHKKISCADLEDADRVDVADLLVRRYTKKEAPNVTFKILEKIGEADLAKDLRSNIGGK